MGGELGFEVNPTVLSQEDWEPDATGFIRSIKKIMADDSTLAFTALCDAMRKAIAAHMRSRGYRVTRGAGAHAKTGDAKPLEHARAIVEAIAGDL